ncbi:MAG: hypothetical protein KBT87_01555 [Gammaproteobacteria bacterium]|nr:hypothetical protein [Gammaproteobacteria bacterium]MBQ0773336.1 hypothetical protein [Gammaproteobacteria bacterium]
MAERDGLQPLAELCKTDIRNTHCVQIDRKTGEWRRITLEDHYAEIEHYSLNDDVAENVAIQYDVARNLYLYAWFEYRFFNIAEAHALNSLELGMKERIGDKEIKRYIKQRNSEYKAKTGKRGGIRIGMKTLMEYCRDQQLVRNEGFSQWHRHASSLAYDQARDEQTLWAIAEMQRTGSTEIETPDIEFKQLPPDPNYNHIQHLIIHTNKTRNNYNHGSTTLHNHVLGTFEMVSEFINQIYSSSERPVATRNNKD